MVRKLFDKTYKHMHPDDDDMKNKSFFGIKGFVYSIGIKKK